MSFGELRVEYEFEVLPTGRSVGPAAINFCSPVLNQDQVEPNRYQFYAFENDELEAPAQPQLLSVGS